MTEAYLDQQREEQEAIRLMWATIAIIIAIGVGIGTIIWVVLYSAK